MKKQYNFSKGVKGKFLVMARDIQLPVYLNKQNNEYFSKLALSKKKDFSKLVNEILSKEREIINTVL